jgi:hypothetical protein
MAIGKRYIDGDKLVDSIKDADGGIRMRIMSWLKRQPRAPKLVSRQGAAKILGRSSPHMERIAERLPEPVEIEGSSWKAYPKDEIKALAKQLKAEKKAKN